MDGGACEATAALASGIPAIGISVPLGNYHNESFEGAPRLHADAAHRHRNSCISTTSMDC